MNDRFDDYARRLAANAPVDRRGLMRRALAAVGIGAGAVVLDAQTASAKPRAACPPGMTACGDVCRDLANANTDCGTCGTACANDSVCRNGTCVKVPCTCGPATSCNDGIKNGTETDVDCGGTCQKCANDKTCLTGSDCQTGNCVAGVCRQCPAGQADCGGVCRDLQSDPAHCGGCGQLCGPVANATSTCIGGSCLHTCNAGFADCDATRPGCETNIMSDNAHCGACGNVCREGTTCSNGACTQTCVRRTCASIGATCGQHSDGCGGSMNCGSCGAGQVCDGRICIASR